MRAGQFGCSRVSKAAVDSVCVIGTMYLCKYLSDANLCTLHRNRVTLTLSDMQLLKCLRENMGIQHMSMLRQLGMCELKYQFSVAQVIL